MLLEVRKMHLLLIEFYKKILLFSYRVCTYRIKHNNIGMHVHIRDTDSKNKRKKNHLICHSDGLEYFVPEYVRILSNEFLLFFSGQFKMFIRRFCNNSSP